MRLLAGGTACPSSALASEGADPCLKAPKYPEYSAKSQVAMHSKTPLGLELSGHAQAKSGTRPSLSEKSRRLLRWGVLVARNFPIMIKTIMSLMNLYQIMAHSGFPQIPMGGHSFVSLLAFVSVSRTPK